MESTSYGSGLQWQYQEQDQQYQNHQYHYDQGFYQQPTLESQHKQGNLNQYPTASQGYSSSGSYSIQDARHSAAAATQGRPGYITHAELDTTAAAQHAHHNYAQQAAGQAYPYNHSGQAEARNLQNIASQPPMPPHDAFAAPPLPPDDDSGPPPLPDDTLPPLPMDEPSEPPPLPPSAPALPAYDQNAQMQPQQLHAQQDSTMLSSSSQVVQGGHQQAPWTPHDSTSGSLAPSTAGAKGGTQHAPAAPGPVAALAGAAFSAAQQQQPPPYAASTQQAPWQAAMQIPSVQGSAGFHQHQHAYGAGAYALHQQQYAYQQQPQYHNPQHGYQPHGWRPSGPLQAGYGYGTQPYQHQQHGYLQQGMQLQAYSSVAPAVPSVPPAAAATTAMGMPGITAPASKATDALKNIIDASSLLRPPDREQRPKKILVVLRGLPGSGKSHVARRMRELEVEHGGEPPRILSMDDYFITEVEKEVVEEEHGGRKGKKRKVVEMEYVYDPDMEGVYLKSLIKSATRTLEEGRFMFVIVEACNTRVNEFKDLLGAAQRLHYEAYVLQPLESDPEVCHKRNVHQRSLQDITKLAQQWEACPALYTQLDVTSLFKPPKTAAANIQEITMEDNSGSEADDAEAPVPDSSAAARTTASISSSRWDTDASDGPAARTAIAKAKGSSKRARPMSDQDILAGLNDMLGSSSSGQAADGAAVPATAVSAAVAGLSSISKVGVRKGVLKKPGAAALVQKTVRWPDQEADDMPAGFTIGVAVKQQLEVMYYLEGLGPAKGDTAIQYMRPAAASFAEQAKAEHQLEHEHLFRQVLFGKKSLQDTPLLPADDDS